MFVCPEHSTIQSQLPKSQFKVLTPGEFINGTTLPVSQLEKGGALALLKFYIVSNIFSVFPFCFQHLLFSFSFIMDLFFAK